MTSTKKWWQGAVAYQVYLRSFQDSNGDGIGDIPGLMSRLGYIRDLGAQAIWMTPPYDSPMKDFGYDVSHYCSIASVFGTMGDFRALIKEADKCDLKIILDHVWSHSSDQHPWFIASADPAHPLHQKYKDYYVWAPARADGRPPNNWQSVFNGSAWTWHEKRQAWYLHNFLEEQPDLNWHNPAVRDEIEGIARFWLNLGVAGFRLDVCNFYAHDPSLADDPVRDPGQPLSFDNLVHVNSINRQETVKYIAELRKKLEADYPDAFLLGEIAALDGGLKAAASYIAPGKKLDSIYSSFLVTPDYPSAAQLAGMIQEAQSHVDPEGAVYWVLGTHDFRRVASRWIAPDATRQKDLLIQANALLLSLPGIAGLYQGEELGLPDAPVTFETMQDPQGIRYGDVGRSRDGCRAPHVWEEKETSPSMGFCAAAKPWLPVPAQYQGLSVKAQAAASGSLLRATRDLIALRRNNPAWAQGKAADIRADGDVLSFTRRAGSQDIKFIFNFSANQRVFDLAETPLQEKWKNAATLDAVRGQVMLQPYGVMILTL